MSTSVWSTGTFRALDPEQTWQNVQPLMAAAGITRVADLTHLDSSGVSVHTAARPRARTLVMSQGKGVSPLLSRVSAVMESLELWFAEREPVTSRRGRSERQLRDDIGYPLDELVLADGSLLGPDTPLDWTDAEFVVSERAALVPTTYVHLDRRVGRTWHPPLFTMSTNGLASGNTVAEAILHGLCEVVERHLVLRGSPNVTSRPVDPMSLGDEVGDLVASLAERDTPVGLFDLSDEPDVPCFCATVSGDGFVTGTFAGFGCHPDSAVAAQRALTEAVQNRVTLIAGTRDDLSLRHYDRPREAGGPAVAPADLPPVDRVRFSGDIEDGMRDVAHAVHRYTGYEPLRVLLTEPDCPVQVVRVVAPGLRQHDLAHLR